MANPLGSCASLCHPRSFLAVMIAMALAACGGSVTSPSAGGASGGPTSSGSGCPGNIPASVGEACGSEGTFCATPSCDPCSMNCPAVTCTHGVWASTVNTGICITAPDASSGTDAGAPGDGGVCVDVDTIGFDQSCAADSDCVSVPVGKLCPNGPSCVCAAGAINASGQSRYTSQVQDLESRIPFGPGSCMCPFFGRARCVASQCVLCGGASSHAGCPDGG